MAKKTDLRTFKVSVIGLSGTEKDKGQVGVGKSCLCNRFINPDADHYNMEHISVISQSDFGGRVINNDHFLYWGEVTKTDEGTNFKFLVIEQTEFIDDGSFAPFKTGRTDPYIKRCMQTKVQSAEKLMYICKDQLGMETDPTYEQKQMPDGKLSIDGFLCCFDVSRVIDRPIEKQVEFCATLLNNVMKTRKPVVLVTTKNDNVKADYVKEVEKLLMRKEYKNGIQLVETSAHENVNVEAAFLVLAHMIDKSRPRKIIPFNEAMKARSEILEVAMEAFKNLLRSKITDSKTNWLNAHRKLENESDFQHFVELYGTKIARTHVKQHTRNLREELINQKQNMFMKQLPDILNHFLPNLEIIGESSDWNACRTQMMQNKDFHSFFKRVCEDGKSWKDSDFVDESQTRHLPLDILYTAEAESCFQNHVDALKAAHRKAQLKQEFWTLLERNVDIPGGTLSDYNQLFEKECFTVLEESERLQVFENYQQQLIHRLRKEFQELLSERPSVFYNLNLDTKLTEDDLNVIYNSLNDDPRFRKFYKLEQERRVMLMNHVVFLENPSVDRCFFHSPSGCCKCTECQVSNILKNQRHLVPNGRSFQSPDSVSSGPLVQPLNLVSIGTDNLAAELLNEIRAVCIDNEYRVARRVYSLNCQLIDGHLDDDNNSMIKPNFKPHGCVYVYNSPESLEYIRSSIPKTFKSSQSSEVVQVVMLAYGPYSQKELEFLRANGRLLATSLQCEFVDITAEELLEKLKFHPLQIEKAFKTIIRGPMQTVRDRFLENTELDLRLLICMMCSDPFPMEIPIQPFLNDDSFVVTSDLETSSINSEEDAVFSVATTVHNAKQRVEVTVTSYHGGHSLLKKRNFYHGYILVYCPKRRASLFSLKSFADAVEAHGGGCLLFLAVQEDGDSINENSQGLKDGKDLAKSKSASFMLSNSNFKSQGAAQVYDKFLRDVWDRRKELEKICSDDQGLPRHYYDEVNIHRAAAPLPTIITDPTENHYSSVSHSTEEESEEPLYDEPNLQQPPAKHQHSNPSPPLPPRSSPPLSIDPLVQYRNDDVLVKPSMLKSRRDQYAAWAINDPKRYQKTLTPRVVSRDSITIELPYGSTTNDDNDDQVKWTENEMYDRTSLVPGSKTNQKPSLYAQCIRPQRPNSAKKSSVHAPLALPEKIEISEDYSTVKDTLVPEGDYALVDDALPKSKHIRIKSNKAEQGSDSDESEGSSLEQDKDIYSKVNRKPTPHKKKHKHQNDGQNDTEHKRRSSDTERLMEHARGRSHSPSQDSTGTGDEPLAGSRASLRKNMKSPGSNTHLSDSDIVSCSSQQGVAAMNEDDDVLTASTEVSIHKVGSEDNDLDLTESGNWNLWFKKKTGKDPMRTLEKKSKDEERRRQRENEKKQKEQQKLQKKFKKKDKTAGQSESGPSLSDFPMSPNNPSVPQFIEKCVEFIESEGLHAEGIYRIPGNKAQVDLLTAKYTGDANINISSLEIQVNAVATVLKAVFADLADPLVPVSLYDELIDASERTRDFNDQGEQKKKERAMALRKVFLKMHPLNFEVLKFLITHLNKVSQNCDQNSMDCKNLARCWWPTLIRMDWDTFEKMTEFSRIPEEILQTLIEQCTYFFHSGNEILN